MKSPQVVIIGSGPAALMAADVVSTGAPEARVTMVEKRRAPGRKILIAGSSGLNISNGLPVPDFARAYSGSMSPGFWDSLLGEFGPVDWIHFVEKELGRETFLGTSGRYFTREMKGSKLLRAWLDRLGARGVELLREEECVDFDESGAGLASGRRLPADALVLALGGASYEPEEQPLRWIRMLERKGLIVEPFRPSNAGWRVDEGAWSPEFLAEAEGKPLKNVVLATARGEKRGELVVTRYGIEGTPVYTVGCAGAAHLDLKPGQSFEELLRRCEEVRENLSPIRRVKRQLGLGEAALALLFHQTPPQTRLDLRKLLAAVKRFPLPLVESQPLTESISSSGGLCFSELDEATLSLRRFPTAFCAGEMLDWDAPTGGFLIQGAVSTGWRAGRGVLSRLAGSDLRA